MGKVPNERRADKHADHSVGANNGNGHSCRVFRRGSCQGEGHGNDCGCTESYEGKADHGWPKVGKEDGEANARNNQYGTYDISPAHADPVNYSV